MAIINPNNDMKACGHISSKMIGSNFGQECRYLRYMYLNVRKNSIRRKTVLLVTCVVVLVDNGVYIDKLGNECRNILSMKFIVFFMTFINHVSQPRSEKCIYNDCDTDNTRSHNRLPTI